MKNFFQKIFGFLHILFGVDLEKWATEYVQPSIEFVEKFKAFLDSPVVNIITALIPGDADDKIVKLMSDNLGKAIDVLQLTDDMVNEPDWTNKILKFTAFLQSCSNATQSALLAKLASELSKITAALNGSAILPDHKVDLLVATQYAKLKSGVTDADLETAVTALSQAVATPTAPAIAAAAAAVAPIVEAAAPAAAPVVAEVAAAVAPVAQAIATPTAPAIEAAVAAVAPVVEAAAPNAAPVVAEVAAAVNAAAPVVNAVEAAVETKSL